MDKKLYDYSRKVKMGEEEPPVILNELKKWINKKYKADLLNIVYQVGDLGPIKGRPLLDFVFETNVGYRKIALLYDVGPKKVYRRAIAKKYDELRKEMKLGRQYRAKDLFIRCEDFSEASLEKACDEMHKNSEIIISKFSQFNICRISGLGTYTVVYAMKTGE